jgi:hypothetical protein
MQEWALRLGPPTGKILFTLWNCVGLQNMCTGNSGVDFRMNAGIKCYRRRMAGVPPSTHLAQKAFQNLGITLEGAPLVCAGLRCHAASSCTKNLVLNVYRRGVW